MLMGLALKFIFSFFFLSVFLSNQFKQQTGLQDLKLGYQMDGIRQVLCIMTLLAYNLIVCYVLSHQEGDIEFCDNVLQTQLKVCVCVFALSYLHETLNQTQMNPQQ